MHDAIGRPLQVGDTVVLTAKITQLSPTPDYCNVTIESVHARRPDGAKETVSAINTAVLLRANAEDLALMIDATPMQAMAKLVADLSAGNEAMVEKAQPAEVPAGETAEEA